MGGTPPDSELAPSAHPAKDIKKQMAYKLAQSTPLMSETEIALNKPLLQLVHRTLESAGGPPSAIPEEPED